MSAQVKDAAGRALHTLWQFFLAALATTWAASGLDITQITSIDAAKRFGIAAAGAVLAALLSAVKSTLASAFARPSKQGGKHEASQTPAA